MQSPRNNTDCGQSRIRDSQFKDPTQSIPDRLTPVNGRLTSVNANFHLPLIESIRPSPHRYTEALLSAVPKPDPRLRSDRVILQGEVADPANTPPGCHFHPRCSYAQAVCREKAPVQEEIAPAHFVSCHRARELSLRGVARDLARKQ